MFGYLMLKSMIREINDFAENMLERRKGHDFIRCCGYYEEIEVKLSRKYPKTYKEYMVAKQKWFKAFDDTQEEWQKYTDEMEYRRILQKQYQLEKIEKEVKIIKQEVECIKLNLEHKL